MSSETDTEIQKLTYQIESVLTYFKKESWGGKPDYRIGALDQFLTYAPNDCWIRARKGRLYVRLGAWLRFDIKHLNFKSIDLVLKCLIKSHLEKEKLDSLLITKPLRFMISKSEFEKFIPLISKLIPNDFSLNKVSATTITTTKSPTISNASIISNANSNSIPQAPKSKPKNQIHVKLISNKKKNDQVSSNDGNNNNNNGSTSNGDHLSNPENSSDSNEDKSKTTGNRTPWSFSRYLSDQMVKKQKQNEVQLKQQQEKTNSDAITSNEDEYGESLTRSQGGILRRLMMIN
ncbi:hypothetical protein B5S30_g5578 [[Candida] boidinii]|nr:hypothetical protein B5S27_g5700 [[Candida] boidinii]OWB70118.1 hypothetical protein B5S30_g5578 [[Candida] boidinii]